MARRSPPLAPDLGEGRPADAWAEPVVLAGGGRAWRAARTVLGVLTGVAFLVVAVTGVWLWLRYSPVPAGVPDGELPDRLAEVREATRLHRAGSIALAVTAILWLVVTAAPRGTPRRLLATGAALAAAGGALAAWTGARLAWDQVALHAVTVGTDVRGLFPDEPVVSYVTDGVERSPQDQELLAWLHGGGALLVVVGLLGATALARARRRRPDDGRLPIAGS